MESVGAMMSNLSLGDNKTSPFESKDIGGLGKLLKEGRFKKIALMVGAGISVNAGIPDFRSKGGFYDKLKAKGYKSPEVVFDISTFRKNPQLFYEVAGDLDTTELKPTLTHYFFRLLSEKGLLLKCFSQNIDGLELDAGLNKNQLVQAHGHFRSAHCSKCGKKCNADLVIAHMRSKTVYFCDQCQGPVKPDVVFFGESLPSEFEEGVKVLDDADLLLIIGTSLLVYPFASLAQMVKKNTPRVFINKNAETTQGFWFKDPKSADMALIGDCDEIIGEIAKICGWKEELDSMVKNVSYLGALDFGTGSTRFILFDNEGNKIAMHQMEITQHFPESNMHEQEPLEYISTAYTCIENALSNINLSQVKAVGITNQRETIIAWDKTTGQPLHRSIIWDDTRTGEICAEFKPHEEKIREKTGLPVSTYFSATKIVWLIRNVPAVSQAITENKCLFGTVESWVLWNITEEKVHITDISNASRTMIMNLQGYWDDELLDIFGIPKSTLPCIKSTAEVYGHFAQGILKGTPLSGSLGDQQAALLGHQCLDPGTAKCTYGTGAFLLMNTGNKPQISKNGLLTTVYGKFGPLSETLYALEGAVECAGSAVKWMMNSLGFFSTYKELETLASSVPNTGGVYCVASFSGIFAPYWDNEAQGVIVGLSQHSTKAHIARAVLEGICFRTAEVIKAMNQDSGIIVKVLSVDGGMTNNSLVLNEQAEIADVNVEVPEEKDLTALGAALAAGVGVNVFKSVESLRRIKKRVEKVVISNHNSTEERWKKWNVAVKKALSQKI